MYLIGAIILIITAVVIYGIRRAIKAKHKKRTQNNDDYNGFHLGEMTRHDVPARFTRRDSKYSGHQYRDGRKEEGTKNEKGKK